MPFLSLLSDWLNNSPIPLSIMCVPLPQFACLKKCSLMNKTAMWQLLLDYLFLNLTCKLRLSYAVTKKLLSITLLNFGWSKLFLHLKEEFSFEITHYVYSCVYIGLAFKTTSCERRQKEIKRGKSNMLNVAGEKHHYIYLMHFLHNLNDIL